MIDPYTHHSAIFELIYRRSLVTNKAGIMLIWPTVNQKGKHLQFHAYYTNL